MSINGQVDYGEDTVVPRWDIWVPFVLVDPVFLDDLGPTTSVFPINPFWFDQRSINPLNLSMSPYNSIPCFRCSRDRSTSFYVLFPLYFETTIFVPLPCNVFRSLELTTFLEVYVVTVFLNSKKTPTDPLPMSPSTLEVSFVTTHSVVVKVTVSRFYFDSWCFFTVPWV